MEDEWRRIVWSSRRYWFAPALFEELEQTSAACT
jgi:hypothetical protein